MSYCCNFGHLWVVSSEKRTCMISIGLEVEYVEWWSYFKIERCFPPKNCACAMIVESLSQCWSCNRNELYSSVQDSAIFSYEPTCGHTSMDFACFKHWKVFKTKSNLSCLLKVFLVSATGLISLHTNYRRIIRIVLWNVLCWLVSCCADLLGVSDSTVIYRERNLLHTTLESKALPWQDTLRSNTHSLYQTLYEVAPSLMINVHHANRF